MNNNVVNGFNHAFGFPLLLGEMRACKNDIELYVGWIRNGIGSY